jgi:hypothetical protein
VLARWRWDDVETVERKADIDLVIEKIQEGSNDVEFIDVTKTVRRQSVTHKSASKATLL